MRRMRRPADECEYRRGWNHITRPALLNANTGGAEITLLAPLFTPSPLFTRVCGLLTLCLSAEVLLCQAHFS